LVATVAGEGSDSLDKATSKAMSVAYRTALLQALCLPTSDPDPDSFSPPPEMPASAPKSKLQQAKTKVWELAQKAGMDVDGLGREFTAVFDKPIGEATTSQLEQFTKHLSAGDEEEKPPTRTMRRADRTPAKRADPPPTPPEPEFEQSGLDEFAPVELISQGQSARMHAAFNGLGITKEERAERLAITAQVIGHEVTTSNELTKDEATKVINHLETISQPDREPPPDGE
jgi:hypothetical protein